MKKILSSGLIACAFLFGFGCNQQGGAVDEAQTTNEERFEDTEVEDRRLDQSEFLTQAASNGMFEVEAGKLAQQRATNQEVKNFAQMMVNDHTAANKELRALAQSKNITLPDSMGQDHMDHMRDLREAQGAEFDREYMDKMESTHNEAVTLFEDSAEDLEDAEVKAFASKTLPKLRQHHERAQQLNETVKNQNNQ